MGGIFTKVGKENANTVPWEKGGRLTTICILNEWLRRVLIYTNGLSGNVTQRVNLSILTDRTRANIYTNEGQVMSIKKSMLWNLWTDYRRRVKIGTEFQVEGFVEKILHEVEQLNIYDKKTKLIFNEELKNRFLHFYYVKEERNLTYFDKISAQRKSSSYKRQIIVSNLTELGNENHKCLEIKKILRNVAIKEEHYLVLLADATDCLLEEIKSGIQ